MIFLKERYNPMKYRKELIFCRYKLKFSEFVKNFNSFNSNLKDFLIEDAFNNQEMCISTTYLVFDRTDHIKWIKEKEKTQLDLLGYVTILNDRISLDLKLKEEFFDKNVHYKSLPALKIGRLCVDDKFRGRYIEPCMLVWAFERAAFLNQNTACRFITLDAERNSDKDKDPFHFYKKYGFNVLKKRKNVSDLQIAQQKSGSTFMYFDLFRIIKTLKTELNF